MPLFDGLSNFAQSDFFTDDTSLNHVPADYYPQFLSAEQQAYLLSETASYPLEKIQIQVFGKWHSIPRTQAWFADKGCAYRYSNVLIQPLPWPSGLLKLRQLLFKRFAIDFNAVLVNHYANGQESMGWHSDDEPEIIKHSPIASISLGASRDFMLRRKEDKFTVKLPLNSGDLLLMQPKMQETWQHAVPKRARVTDSRVNLTFRQIIPDYYLD